MRYAYCALLSVDPLTRDLQGPRIEHQAHRRTGPAAQERKASVIAAIYEELIARHRDDRGGGTLLKVEDRQRAAGLDLELAIL